jgi:hypothetical protein
MMAAAAVVELVYWAKELMVLEVRGLLALVEAGVVAAQTVVPLYREVDSVVTLAQAVAAVAIKMTQAMAGEVMDRAGRYALSGPATLVNSHQPTQETCNGTLHSYC